MNRTTPRSFLLGLAVALVAVGNSPAWAVATLPISQLPLTLPVNGTPQVLFAVGNSQSMDGDLGGAIQTGSGALPAALNSLQNSSSPVNYIVPAGFTAPNGGVSGSTQPYTTVSGATQTDNSASRLNVAKQGISQIIAQYAGKMDFALEDYNAATGSTFTTWVYLMSGSPGFTFNTSNAAPPAGFEYVANPCFNYLTASATIKSNCTSIVTAGLYPSATLNNNNFMLVAQSSDDASVVDVLYASGGLSAVFDTFGGPNPPTPFPPNFSLAQYNNGSIFVQYNASAPNNGAFGTSPTNAGFVPFSPQVMYEERGFGYFSNANPTTGTIQVPMQDVTVVTPALEISAFVPILLPETNNNPASTGMKALAVQSPIAGLMRQARLYMTGAGAAALPVLTCGAHRYVVLLSDGLPTEDLNGKSWPPLGSASSAGYGETATFNPDGSLNVTNDQALIDTISQINGLNGAGVQTYVIGLGAGVNPALNPQAAATLKAMAVAGGTTNYFAATSAAALTTDLGVILASIQNQTVSSGSQPVLGARLTGSSLSYLSSFKANGADWTGNLAAIPLNADGTPSTVAVPNLFDGTLFNEIWHAGTFLNTNYSTSPAAAASRNVFVMTKPGSISLGTGTAASFTAGNIGGTAAQQMAFLGFPPLDPTQFGAHGNATEIVSYLRGDQTQTTSAAPTPGPFRSRTSILGDIVDSVPAVSSSNDDFGFSSLPAVDGGTTYATFVSSKASRVPQTMVYVGANDGMLHAFDGSVGGGGQEIFAFIPNSVTSNLGKLADPNYAHQFYVNGPITVADAYLGGSWQTDLVATPGAGGSGLFALNVTSPSGFNASKVLWELTAASSPYMGYDLGDAQVILGEDDNWYAIVGNGYNSTNAQPALFVIDMATGAIKTTLVGTTDPVAAHGNGIGQIVALDSDGDGKVDTVYGGDYDGDIWKFDLSAASAASWKVGNGLNPLFIAKDAGGNRQPITGKFETAAGPLGGVMLYFGTGSFFLTGDNVIPATPQVQSIYGLWDQPDASGAIEPGTVATVTRANLVQQSILSGTATSRQTSALGVAYTVSGGPRGFFMDLKVGAAAGDGELFAGVPVVQQGTVFFTTFEQLVGSGCVAGGNRWLYGLSGLTGANALGQISDVGGAASCPGGGCGGVLVGQGSLVPSTSVVIPAPTCLPGQVCNAPIPVRPCDWAHDNGGCIDPSPLPGFGSLQTKCVFVLVVSGAPSRQLPRACGRQSWRQVR